MIIDVSILALWCLFVTSFIVGVIAVELDLRRNLKRDSRRVPMVFGKDIIIKDTK